MRSIKTLLTALALTFAIGAAADEYACLTIAHDGGETSYTVSEIDKITFDATDMVLHITDGTEQRLALAGLQRMFFGEGTQAIATVKSAHPAITVANGRLSVKVAPGDHAALYNLKGEQVLYTDHDVDLDLRSMPRGVYIVKTGRQTSKVTAQ